MGGEENERQECRSLERKIEGELHIIKVDNTLLVHVHCPF